MKIALIGGSGMIGQRVLQEALSRGHEVTVIVRDPQKVQATGANVVQADALDVPALAQVIAGHDVLVSAHNAPHDNPTQFKDVAHTIIQAAKDAAIPRLIVVGGAGSLEAAPGVALADTPQFPDAWRAGAQALRDARDLYKASGLNWTFFSPAIMIQPGERTGQFRLGGLQPVFDANGNSSISAEDYAIALVDELETPAHERQQFTIGY